MPAQMSRSGGRKPRVHGSSHAAKEVGRPGFRGFSRVTGFGKRSIRRLIKRDPAIGTTQPFADKITTTPGVTGLSGPTQAAQMSKSHTPAPNAGKKVIRPARKGLKKR